MGNCQTAEAAAAVVVIQHPDGKVERLHSSITAGEVMGSNPGNYVAVFILPPSSPSGKTANEKLQRHLKLLRPDDSLQIGRVYRLVTFEDVLKEITAKKHVKLDKLKLSSSSGGTSETPPEVEMEETMAGGRIENSRRLGRDGSSHWRPVLQTIEECKTTTITERKRKISSYSLKIGCKSESMD